MWRGMFSSSTITVRTVGIPHRKSTLAHFPWPVLTMSNLAHVALGSWNPSRVWVGSCGGIPLVGLCWFRSFFHLSSMLKIVLLRAAAVFIAGFLDFSLDPWIAGISSYMGSSGLFAIFCYSHCTSQMGEAMLASTGSHWVQLFQVYPLQYALGYLVEYRP